MNEKLKIYLDTSVISYLLQEDVPDKMEITNRLWELFGKGKYKLYLSNVTMKEVSKYHGILNLLSIFELSGAFERLLI